MRNLVGIGFVGLLAAVSARAQKIVLAPPPIADAVVSALTGSLGCPVDMSAQRTPGGALAYAGGSGQGSGQNGVHVSLKALTGDRIREASLTVHALSARSRLLPASVDDAPDIARNFHLVGGKQGAVLLDGEASVSGKATVVYVDIEELRYADGRIWQPAAGASCRFEPDGFLPVASLR